MVLGKLPYILYSLVENGLRAKVFCCKSMVFQKRAKKFTGSPYVCAPWDFILPISFQCTVAKLSRFLTSIRPF
jgi:hypothetical protein